MKITEGYMPFRGFRTYYRIAGESTGGHKPLILLHGGPGSTHNYFEVLDRISGEGRAVISYDQIGCGNSYTDNHPELWTEEFWRSELEALIDYLHLDSFHLLGQSWGGMLEISYLLNCSHNGVRSAVLSSTLSSASLWSRELHRMIAFLPAHEQEAIRRAEESGDYSSEEYQKANDHFMTLFCSGPVSENDPECLRRKKKSGTEAYLCAWGPNEYTPSGSLRNFEYTGRLKEIDVPCLIISGTNDLCTPLTAKTLFDGIPDSRWELFENARHTVFAEQTDRYCQILTQWLNEHD
ncbi:MAG: proline iminopeptidase-family hydrolase [Solobacterium sp.]|nr:proline iminopeptidase-family hydrolase [Solobacterium sp.]